MPQLFVRSGGSRDRSVAFTRMAVIGRGTGVDLALRDRGVSSRHAMIRVADGISFVMDLGSQNGTFVNQRRIDKPVRLSDGDTMRFGDSVVEFSSVEPGADRPTATSTAIRFREGGQGATRILLAVPAELTKGTGANAASDDAANAALARQSRLQDRLTKTLASSLVPADWLPAVVDALFDFLPPAERVLVLLGSDALDSMRLEASRVRDGSTTDVVISRTLLQRAIERREGLLFADLLLDKKYSEAESIRGAKLRSAMSVPLVCDNEVYGVIQIDSRKAVAAFSQIDLRAVVAVASQLAVSLAYAKLHAKQLAQELLEHDLSLAQRVQRQFLPETLPVVQGYDFSVEYRSALAVGGDFYDFITLDRDRLAVIVGDVSGKGVSAAIYGAKLLAELRILARTHREPSRILAELNRVLAVTDREGMFATVVMVVLDPESDEVSVATAGHPLPLVRDRAGAVSALGQMGPPPLGIDADASFEQHRFSLDDGDCLVLFTDGISEAPNPTGDLFGVDGLEKTIGGCRGDAEVVRTDVLDALDTFVDGHPQADDITLVCVNRSASA
ncbi:MAG: SpoIIE family protein phosphatase [Vicinamibacterales bacterium]